MKNTYNFKKTLLLPLLFLVAVIYGCGSAHVKTEMTSADVHSYKKMYIGEITVESHEEGAKANEELQKKLAEWKVFVRKELEDYIRESHYQLLDKLGGNTASTLTASLKTEVAYGNRALRYWAGIFGAGKGGVDSVLAVTDNKGKVKFKAVASSDLSVGAFGGNMGTVLQKNIKKLIEQYPPQLGASTPAPAASK